MGLYFRTLKRGMRNGVKMNFWSQATFKMNTFRLGYLLFSDFIKISDKGIMQHFLKLRALRKGYKESECYSLT